MLLTWLFRTGRILTSRVIRLNRYTKAQYTVILIPRDQRKEDKKNYCRNLQGDRRAQGKTNRLSSHRMEHF